MQLSFSFTSSLTSKSKMSQISEEYFAENDLQLISRLW